MSQYNEYRHKSQNKELENIIVSERKLAHGDMSKFKFRVFDVVLGRHRDDIGVLVRHDIEVTPDPDEPEGTRYHFQLSIIPRVIPQAYPQLLGQLMHTVERYWKDKKAKEIITKLSSAERELLLMFLEHHYLQLEDFIDQYTRLELENYGVSPVPVSRPKIQVTDDRLMTLESYGLVSVDFAGINRTAVITNEGMYTAYCLKDINNPKPPSSQA